MIPLIDGYPRTLTVAGREYPVRWDHKTGILLSTLIEDEGIAPYEKPGLMLRLFYFDVPMQNNEVMNAMFWFMRCGREQVFGGARAYDFMEDWSLMVAAFRQVYGMDIVQGKIHWWEFIALLGALPEGCPMAQIMSWRTMEIDGDLPEATQAHYRKMKAKYALEGKGLQRGFAEVISDAIMRGRKT